MKLTKFTLTLYTYFMYIQCSLKQTCMHSQLQHTMQPYTVIPIKNLAPSHSSVYQWLGTAPLTPLGYLWSVPAPKPEQVSQHIQQLGGKDGGVPSEPVGTSGLDSIEKKECHCRPPKGGKPPEGYICHLCFTTGHYIYDCPKVSITPEFTIIAIV